VPIKRNKFNQKIIFKWRHGMEAPVQQFMAKFSMDPSCQYYIKGLSIKEIERRIYLLILGLMVKIVLGETFTYKDLRAACQYIIQ
jgi:hypothetical protein